MARTSRIIKSPAFIINFSSLISDRAHTYKTYLVKEDGSFNDLHFIWKSKTVAQNTQIQSGRSDLARYKFVVPNNIGGQIKLTAKLNYRRFTRVLSRLDKAEEEFKQVSAAFPRDRLTLQQLGELAKIKSDTVAPEERKNQLGIVENYYNQVLAIDPEDTGAHYNLMIIYQKLGRRDEAKKEAVIFKELKDDPSVTNIASNFLQTNWNIGNESLPFHTHDLQLFDVKLQKTNYLAWLSK